MNTVWLVTTGSGDDGDEWDVLGIYATAAGAERAKEQYELPQKRIDGSTFAFEATIEEWSVKE